MSDGRILAILNSAVVQNVQGSNSAASHSAPPGNLSTLLPGGVVRGEVIGRDSGGNPILRTAQGSDITIRTETFLKYGNQVVIKVDPTGQGARILSIDGLSPQNANPTIPANPDAVQDEILTNQSVPRGGSSASPTLVAALASQSEETTEAQLIRSTLLSKSPTAQAVLSNLPAATRIPVDTLQPGTQVFIRLASTQPTQYAQLNAPIPGNPAPPTSGQQNISVSPLEKLLAPASPNPQQTTPQTASSSSVSLPAQPLAAASTANRAPVPANITVQTGSAPNLQASQPSPVIQQGMASAPQSPANTAQVASTNTQVGSQNPPQQQPASSSDPRSVVRPVYQTPVSVAQQASAANSSSLPATFMAFDAKGDATFQSQLGILKMPQGMLGSIRMSPGTPLLFEIAGFRPASPAAIASGALASMNYTNLTGMTDTLSDILTIVQSVNPQAGAELAARMPQTGPNFTGSTLFFIAAMTGGDAGKLLGSRVTNLLEQQGRGDLIRKLGSDFSIARTGFGESSQTQNWQLFFIPLMHEQELQPVRMFVKKDKENEEKNKKKKADTRFIIEVSLSVLGDIQIDGFVRHKEKGLQFDLMLRTLQPLMPEDEQAILEIYNNAAQIAGFTGSLNIQSLKEFPVKPMEEMLGSNEGSITA